GSYGGGFEPPITHELAFLEVGRDRQLQTLATIGSHQPHALAWDSAHDALYVAGVGNDAIVQIKNASQIGITEGLVATTTNGKDKCGPEGIAVTDHGDVLEWCSFTRNVEHVSFVDGKGQLAAASKVDVGP